MIDRDSYWPGPRGEEAFLADARALLAAVEAYVALDHALDIGTGAADSQRLFDLNRHGLAASASDELGASCDLLADVAREFASPIERDLRDARRLIEALYNEPAGQREPPLLQTIRAPLADAARLRDVKVWRHD